MLPKEAEVKHVEPEREPGESFVDRLTGLFKRGAAHQDYPTSEVYEGPLASTSRAYEVDGVPLEQHVTAYHSGRSDEVLPKEEPVAKEPSKDAFERLAGLFKKGTAHQDYPVSDVFEGPLASTSRAYDVEGIPLEQHVSVYHSGRSDEVLPKEPEVKHAEPEGESFVDKLTGLFKRGTAHQDYPTTEVYEGPLASTSRAYEVDGIPLEQHVSV